MAFTACEFDVLPDNIDVSNSNYGIGMFLLLVINVTYLKTISIHLLQDLI